MIAMFGRVGTLIGLAFIAALLIPAAASATPFTTAGVANVIKPYAFELNGYQVYLLGVDSVEVGQPCRIDRQNWDCWAAAQRQLETILSEGEVTCEAVVGPTEDLKMIALCTTGGEDIGERFVRSGFGVTIPAETERYEEVQAEARANRIGLWQGQFTPPAVWRGAPMRPSSGRPRFQ
jgi:endonuclease YncB( thermonuclease family)